MQKMRYSMLGSRLTQVTNTMIIVSISRKFINHITALPVNQQRCIAAVMLQKMSVVCSFVFVYQRGVHQLQCTDGLHHFGSRFVELRHCRYDYHLLERSTETAAGVSHHHLSSAGSYRHQIRPRVDAVVSTWSPRSLG